MYEFSRFGSKLLRSWLEFDKYNNCSRIVLHSFRLIKEPFITSLSKVLITAEKVLVLSFEYNPPIIDNIGLTIE